MAAVRPVTHIAAELGDSRQTTYRWVRRFRAEGPGGLEDRSSRPRSFPARTSSEREQAVLDARRSVRFGPLRIASLTGVPIRAAGYFAGHGIHRIERVVTDNAFAYRNSAAFHQAVADLGAVPYT